MKTLARNIIITILAFVLVSSFALIALKLPFMGPIAEAIKEFEMTDVYCQILQDTNDDDEEVSDDITIVDMSELYSRRDLAKALVDIEKQNPKVIGVDIVFEGLKEDSVGDEMLTRIALENTKIVFSYKLLDYVNDSIGHADTVHSFFVDESDSINEGYTNMPRNLYGGIKRKLSLGEKVEGRLMPSFITKVSAMYEGRQVKDVSKKTININYIPKRFRVVEADSISVHPEWIKDKLVLFGAMKDEYDMDSLVQRFDSYDYVDKPVFNVLSDAQENDKRISCTVDYDFETGILTFKGNGEQESEYYDLNFLESAIERAERGGVGEAQRHDSFNADIEWYINQSQSRYSDGEDEGSTMRL